MRVLVSGLPGWLGNRFLEVLVQGFNQEGPAKHWDIRALVLKGTDISFIQKLSPFKKIECIKGDVTDASTLTTAMKDCDVVFHLVGIIHPKKIKDLYTVNTQGTENMLKASVAAGVKRFVYISSNSVGGTQKQKSKLMTENDAPHPYFNYGKSKHLAELAVKKYTDSGQIESVILRPCWYYGPNQPDRQTTFFRMIKKGNPIIFGNGHNLRSMSYLDNTIQAMILAAEKPGVSGQTYWIADEKPYETIDIYKTVADLLEVKNFKPRFIPAVTSSMCEIADSVLQGVDMYIKEIHVAGEMTKNIACSVEKAKKELGYSPTVSLREGMKRSITWCLANGQCI